MFKHAKMDLRDYVLALEGRDDAYTMGRDWGIGVISKCGHAKKGNARLILIQTQIDQPL